MVVYMSGIYERSGREPFTVLVLVFHSLLLSLHCETVFAFVFDGFVFAHIDHEGFSTVCDQALNNVFTYLWTVGRGRGVDGACSLDQQLCRLSSRSNTVDCWSAEDRSLINRIGRSNRD